MALITLVDASREKRWSIEIKLKCDAQNVTGLIQRVNGNRAERDISLNSERLTVLQGSVRRSATVQGVKDPSA